ncbi:NlpC/P60 family protein [Pseudaeromonas sp. ZJS20]|uniref:NlpC/P60 family protein n=1 Tax=Pseudaeromonas aegiceratis TaxID=3153928 RepID=UPI00390C7CE9
MLRPALRPTLPFALTLLLLAGCQSPPPPVTHTTPQTVVDSDLLLDPLLIRAQLFEQYHHWKGVPYRAGGQSRRGVDCSGFVQLTFAERFGLDLPRDTSGQATQGRPVSQQALQPGDLLFFKTGYHTRHVGIYLKDRQFLHASTSHGVIISELDNPYWSRHYWQARRLP